jgi:hypothetical protein
MTVWERVLRSPEKGGISGHGCCGGLGGGGREEGMMLCAFAEVLQQ